MAGDTSDRSGRELTADEAINNYRNLHQTWFSPGIGAPRVNQVESATLDRLSGDMRQVVLSTSRLNQTKSLYRPFFRWARRRAMATRDPMSTSRYA